MMNTEHILQLVRSGELDISEAQRLLEEAARSSASGDSPGPACGAAAKSASDAAPAADADAESLPGLYRDSGEDGDLGFAQLDLRRAERTGFPEVIFGEGKTPSQITEIFRRLQAHIPRVLATRVSLDKAQLILQDIPEASYHPQARTLSWVREGTAPVGPGYIAVLCAGTSDLPVAEEAAITAETMGCRVERVYDVGVAGIHRLFRRLPLIRGASAVVVAAGMEGALASVVGGLVAVPIIAVPTSIGYGASFQGMAALLSMLNACAPGISVVNIDNGFGAGYNAALIYHNSVKRDER